MVAECVGVYVPDAHTTFIFEEVLELLAVLLLERSIGMLPVQAYGRGPE